MSGKLVDAPDEAMKLLKQDGWLISDQTVGYHWVVNGSKGAFVIDAVGRSRQEAWGVAMEQAQLLKNMLTLVMSPHPHAVRKAG